MANEFVGLAAPLSQAGFDAVVRQLGSDAASLWALINVETDGFGFLPDRRPKLLFERHQFHKRTGGRFDAANPDISSAVRGGQLSGTAEYARFARALALDRRAALESTSWGLGQIMGFNATRLGYASAEAMVTQFRAGEDAQLDGVSRYLRDNPALATAFGKGNWAKVAFFYNGSAFAENKYDIKLQRFHDLFTISGTPSIEVRAAQARLSYLGFDPRGVDGVVGHGTRSAVIAFQKARGLNTTGELDEGTMAGLREAAQV